MDLSIDNITFEICITLLTVCFKYFKGDRWEESLTFETVTVDYDFKCCLGENYFFVDIGNGIGTCRVVGFVIKSVF